LSIERSLVVRSVELFGWYGEHWRLGALTHILQYDIRALDARTRSDERMGLPLSRVGPSLFSPMRSGTLVRLGMSPTGQQRDHRT